MLRPWTQAARALVRRPAFAVSAILILAAGVAATTGVFTVVDAAVLKPLPYPDPGRLVLVLEANPVKKEVAGLIAPARIEDWDRLNRTFEAVAGSYGENVTETSGDVPERLAARRVSPRYFKVFDVQPVVGRTFVPEEEASGGPAVVVISDGLWARRFQRSRNVTTRRLTLGGKSYAIAGVMPPTFDDRLLDLWIPAQTPSFLMQARDARFYTGIGRMRRGVTIAAAQADLSRVQAELGQQYPKTDKDWSAQVTDLATSRLGQYRAPLLFVLGAVALLLLIALANTAGLTLTQLQRRESELAIRGFLGATRVQVVAGVVQEILILAAVASVVAMIADVVLLRLASTALASLPRTAGLTIDWRAFTVASVSAAIAGLVCGAVPAWRATRRGAAATFSRGVRGSSYDSRSQRLLVGGQIAIATLLLCATGLMLRSYYALSHVDPGFDPSHTVTFHVGAAWDEDRVAVGQMQQRILAELGALPGVSAVGFSNFLPASSATIRYQVRLQNAAGGAGAAPDQDQITVGERSVTRDYFKALGARLSAGEACPELAAVRQGPRKALVNRRFATSYGEGQGVVGRFIGFAQGQPPQPMQIAGVVDDLREDNLRTAAVPYLYVCLGPGDWPDPEYVVRTAGDPHALLPAIRSVIHGIAPSRAVFALMPLEETLGATVGQTRLQAELLAAFGVAAVALAAIGLYGLVALAVTSRRREIGIRIALGADPQRVVWELASRVGWLIAGGAACGLILTALGQRQLRAVVFGVAPLDPATLIAAVVVLGVSATVATLVPALRAAKIDPVGAMRES
jgi:putative ABC transport system permease protein